MGQRSEITPDKEIFGRWLHPTRSQGSRNERTNAQIRSIDRTTIAYIPTSSSNRSLLYHSCNDLHPGLAMLLPPRNRGARILPPSIVCATIASTSCGVTRPYQTLCPAGKQICDIVSPSHTSTTSESHSQLRSPRICARLCASSSR